MFLSVVIKKTEHPSQSIEHHEALEKDQDNWLEDNACNLSISYIVMIVFRSCE